MNKYSSGNLLLTSRKQLAEVYPKFKKHIQGMLKDLTNHIKIEERQPIFTTTNEPTVLKGKPISSYQTLTIFIHGYKGSEYDLSKVKAYMTIFQAAHHFYALKTLSGE